MIPTVKRHLSHPGGEMSEEINSLQDLLLWGFWAFIRSEMVSWLDTPLALLTTVLQSVHHHNTHYTSVEKQGITGKRVYAHSVTSNMPSFTRRLKFFIEVNAEQIPSDVTHIPCLLGPLITHTHTHTPKTINIRQSGPQRTTQHTTLSTLNVNALNWIFGGPCNSHPGICFTSIEEPAVWNMAV